MAGSRCMALTRITLAVVSGLAITAAAQTPAPASMLIRGAIVFDGTGAPGRRADVWIAGDRIAAVGQLPPQPGERVVEAGGLALAPGFIDTHSHHDRGLDTAPDALAIV